MDTPHLLWLGPLLAMLLWAAYEDFRIRKIRNWLTFSLILSGFFQTFFQISPVSPGQSALGFAVGFGLPFVLFVMGAVGGGDVKLLAGVGAWVGAAAVFKVFCGEAIIGMVIVLFQATLQGRLKVLTRNSAMLAVNLIHLDEVGLEQATLAGQSCRGVDRPLPFAVPVLLAVIALMVAGQIS
jgi:Flp pilus assembly protein protease CpaA